MYPVSSEFKSRVMGSHQAPIRVQVLFPDSTTQDIPITGGSVDIDDSREIRTTCTINVADPSLVPKVKGDLLHPDTGNEIVIYRGVVTSSGAEYVPLGIFVPTKPSMSQDKSNFGFQITGSDRALRVQRAEWVKPFNVAGGTNIVAAASAMLNDRVPGLPALAYSPTDATVPPVTFGLDASNDPWADIQGLFSANGQEIFFNAVGRPVSRPIPDTINSPVVATYSSGSSPLLSVERDIDSSQRYTAVVVRGEGTGVAAPFYAMATDPTAIDIFPYFITSNMVLTQDQANAAAASMLLKVGSSYEDVKITIVPNSALQAGDVIQIEHDPVGLNGRYVASQLSIPLSQTDPMTITMKPQRQVTA